MKNKTAVLLVVALVCGLGAAYLTSKVIADRSKAPQEEKVEVLVAKTAVPQYKPIKEPEKFFEKKTVTKSEAPKGALTRMEDVKGKRLKVPLSQDKVLTQADLLDDKATGAGMQARVPEGYLAISIKVTQDSGVAGFILPHTKVDVIATLKRNDIKSTAQIILQDVLVLAVGGKADPDDSTQSMVAQTVTLALKPEDVMKISLAADVAQLRLALRGEGDETQRALTPIKVGDVIKGVPGEGPDGETLPPGKNPGTTVIGLPLPQGTGGEDRPTPVWSFRVREGDQTVTKNYIRNKNGDLVIEGKSEKSEAKKEEPSTPPATESKD